MDYLEGICCQCKDEYYGNGKTCIKDDVPLRVHGKIFGDINGITINDVNIQAYVVMADGRSYTALSQGPQEIGSSLQSLNILGGVIGWLFAKPVGNVKNGYQLTGGVFNHTADIFYPGTGDTVSIKQEFLGLDVFDQLRLEADIRGTVPVIETDHRLDINDYTEDYTIIDSGNIRSQSTRFFINKHTNSRIEQRLTQTFSFNPCRFAPFSEEDQVPFTLQVTKNYLGYEIKDNVVRYGMSNRVIPIGHEDPCIRGRETCGSNSVCVVEGDSFKCICNTGYTNIYRSNDAPCTDIDECQTGTHNCDINADCYNYDGAFGCRCKVGYEGNGVSCNRRPSGCSAITCDVNALCVDNFQENSAHCICNPGFSGNGQQCSPIKGASCNEVNNCSPHGACVFSTSTDSYICQCNAGYAGDGYDCSLDIYSTTTEITEAEYNEKYVLPTCNEYSCVCPPEYTHYVDEHKNDLCRRSEHFQYPERDYNGTGSKYLYNYIFYTCLTESSWYS